MTYSRLFVAAVVLSACGSASGDDPDVDAAPGSSDAADSDASPAAPRVEQLIRSEDKSRLVFEIDAVPGLEPRATVTNDIVALFDDILDKPDGVVATTDGVLTSRGADYAWTESELRSLADDTFDLDVSADTIKLHVLFVDGHSARDDDSGKILGLAWSHTHLVLFKDTIEDICGGFIGLTPLLREQLCENAELAIWTHEVGHLIGLVDNGLPMAQPHRDPDHGAHDDDSDCVMYWAYDSDALIDLLGQRLLAGNGTAIPFDDACLNDIAALRDR